jgi:hypothetical protein
VKYTHKKFTVPAVGSRDPKDCDHTKPWVDLKGNCVQCGTKLMDDPRGIYLLRQRAD